MLLLYVSKLIGQVKAAERQADKTDWQKYTSKIIWSVGIANTMHKTEIMFLTIVIIFPFQSEINSLTHQDNFGL